MDLAARRRRMMSRCQRKIVSGVTSSRSPFAARFRYHAEQGRDECPVCPVQIRALRLMPLQDGELVAQDQDLGDLPSFVAAGQSEPRGHPCDQEEDEPQAHDW
jgi:hypothetical protein